jgi:MFS family permease
MNTTQTLPFERAFPIFIIVFVDVLGLTLILPLLHLYGAAYGAAPAEIGLIAASFPLAQLIGVPLMGALSDRFGRKPLLLISQVSTFIGFVLLGLATSVEMILLSRIIDGILGANLATAQAALSDITDDANRVRGLGLTGAAFGLGFIFGPMMTILTLEMTNDLAAPALAAAGYSLLSIFLTLFMFRETLPPEKRRLPSPPAPSPTRGEGVALPKLFRLLLQPLLPALPPQSRNVALPKLFRLLLQPQIGVLLIVMFAQQLIFFAFETLLGLFTLSRLGLVGQSNALLFLYIGAILVMVQVRYIGKWSRRYGERKLVFFALALLAGGLLLLAMTPEQPHPFYVRKLAEFDLRAQAISTTEALVGTIAVPLPADGNNGLGGIVWLLVAILPLSIGSALIRPCLNTLITRRVSPQEFGSVLGLSAGAVSAANALAPLLGGVIFQQYGVNAPFLAGGVLLVLLWGVSIFVLRQD